MPNTKELALSPYPHILIVGDGGTRKTWISGQFPSPYFFDFDKGMSILRGVPVDYDTFKEAPRGSKVFNPEKGIYEFGKCYPAFLLKLNDIGAQIDAGTCPFKTLVMDSLTTFGNVALNHVLYEAAKDGRYKWGDPVDQGLWGAQMRLMETVMDQLTAWDIMLVVTAHVQRDTNTVTMNVEKLPLTTGKFAGKVGVYFDDVWYMEPEAEGAIVIKTKQNKMMRQAKSRYNVADGSAVDWNVIKKFLLEPAAQPAAQRAVPLARR